MLQGDGGEIRSGGSFAAERARASMTRGALGGCRVRTSDIEYHAEGRRFVGYLAVDETRMGRRPGVLLAPEGLGLGDLWQVLRPRLAELGYVALAMDYYGDGALLEMGDIMPRIQALTADPPPIRRIAAAALDTLKSQAETDASRLAAIGYCFWWNNRSRTRALAPSWPRRWRSTRARTARPAEPRQVKAKILAQIGSEDPIVQVEARLAFEREMTAARADWRLQPLRRRRPFFHQPRRRPPWAPRLRL